MRIELHQTVTTYEVEYAGNIYRIIKSRLEKNCNGKPVNDITVFHAGRLVQDQNIFQFMINAIAEYEKKRS